MPNDHEVAIAVADAAGALLLEIRAGGLEGRALGDRGDAAAHQRILELLGELRPDDPVLSEEGADDRARLGAARLWIVDPLDGTREYGEPGRTDWAVHIALVDGDGVPTAGAVALPAQGITWATEPAAPVVPVDRVRPRVVASRTRDVPEVAAVAEALGGDIVRLGSAGAKAMAVVSGEVDIYVHSGGQYEWDNCAPAAVALAAGYHASRIDGSPLRYNNESTWVPDLLICRPELARAVLAVVAGPA